MIQTVTSIFSVAPKISVFSYDSDEDEDEINSLSVIKAFQSIGNLYKNFDRETNTIVKKCERIFSNIYEAAKEQISLYCKYTYAISIREIPRLKYDQKEWEVLFAIIECEVTKAFEEIHKSFELIAMGYYVKAGIPTWVFKFEMKKVPIFFGDKVDYPSSEDYLIRLSEVANKSIPNLISLCLTNSKRHKIFSDLKILEKIPQDLTDFIITRIEDCGAKAKEIVKNE